MRSRKTISRSRPGWDTGTLSVARNLNRTWYSAVINRADWKPKLGNVWLFVQLILGLVCQWISWTKTQTLPNLRLPIGSVYKLLSVGCCAKVTCSLSLHFRLFLQEKAALRRPLPALCPTYIQYGIINWRHHQRWTKLGDRPGSVLVRNLLPLHGGGDTRELPVRKCLRWLSSTDWLASYLHLLKK